MVTRCLLPISVAAIAIAGATIAVIARADDKPAAARPAWTTSRIVGTPGAPEPYRLVNAFPNLRFEKPTSIEDMPGTRRLLVTEMAGRIFSFPHQTDARQPDLVVDLRELLPADLRERGVSLFDAELHPRFAESRWLLVCYVHPGEGGHTRVSRLTLNNEAVPRMVPGSEQVVMTWPSGGHNAGCIEFGRDGNLYIATGDGSGPNPPDGLTTGQDVSDLLGAILRINVDRTEGHRPYTIPADNPFVNRPNTRPEIWAFGLRNPWKIGVDPTTGDIFAADNGWETWESIHRIVRGGNCGWPIREGRAALRMEVQPGPTPILPPAKDHPHTEANSVIGGPVYRGTKLPGLVGSFVYGDYITGTIWAIRPDQDGAYSHTTLVDTDQRIIAFTQTTGGELYVLDYDFTGQIYELLPTDRQDNSANFPRRLSETELFTSLSNLDPAPGVVPYSVRVEPWMDGAQAQRWVAIPNLDRIQLPPNRDALATYPEGTVLVKHLTLPAEKARAPIRLETQLLHYDHGVWRPYSYLWDDEGRDAQLVDAAGVLRLRIADARSTTGFTERTWRVNATNECKLCHDPGARFVLGFTPLQLQRPLATGSRDASEQLARLVSQGVLVSPASVPTITSPRLVDPNDRSESLEDRARSYLHANCSMCHHPGGNAIVSFYLRRDLPFDQLNTNKGTGIGTFGLRDARIIVPGDPYRSILLYRMSKLGYARMPYIGSQVVDSAGVSLVDEWIQSIGQTGDALAFPIVIPPGSSQEQRQEAIGQLLRTTRGALLLALQLHRGALSESDRTAVVQLGSSTSSSDIRGLFETFLPESQRRKTLGMRTDPQSILELTGDRDRGKLIFFSDGARCRACHDIDDRAKSLGPTLLEIKQKYPRPPELIQHVLQPSVKIDDPFAAHAVVLDDGRVLQGLILEKTDREVVVKTVEKQVMRVPAKSVAEMRRSDKSLMPDNLLSDLTAQEAADLFEYLRSAN